MASDTDFLEVSEVTTLNNLQIYQQDKAAIDMQIATAKQYPRNELKAIRNAIALVQLDIEIAESCTFSITKGGKNITGPSVHLARILAQKYGNMRVDQRVVGYDQTHVTVEAVAFDLENNYAYRSQIKKSIVGNNGRFGDDMIVITGNAAAAIAFRNAVFTVINKDVVNKVYKSALEKITGDISDETKLTTKRTKIFEGFKQSYSHLNLTDVEIAKSVGKNSIDHITAEDIVTLIGFEKSIKEGEQAPENIFRPTLQNNSRPTPPSSASKEVDRIKLLINAATTVKDLEKLKTNLSNSELAYMYDEKLKTLKK